MNVNKVNHTNYFSDFKRDVANCGVVYNRGVIKHSLITHMHDYIELEFLESGNCANVINGEWNDFSAGSFSCIGQDNAHCIIVPKNGEAKFHNVCIFTDDISEDLRSLLDKLKYPTVGHLGPNDQQTFIRLAEDLHLELKSRLEHSGERSYALTTLIVIMFLRSQISHTITSINGYIPNVNKAYKYIADNFDSQITLSDVAKHVGVSDGYMSRMFSAKTGCSMVEYLTRVRIRKAQALLITTEKSVIDVGFECGFGSYASFVRAFNKVSGVSPTEYKKNYRIN